MLTRTFPVLLVVLSIGASLGAQKKPDDKIRVFVKPTPAAAGGYVDEESKRVSDSRKDFVERLKDKAFVQVEQEDGADVVLEIVSSAREELGKQSTTVNRSVVDGRVTGSTTEEATGRTVRVMLTAPSYTNEFVGMGLGWRHASLEAALKIRKWIKDNRARLLEMRK